VNGKGGKLAGFRFGHFQLLQDFSVLAGFGRGEEG
jgi:hypothetical protein